MSKKALTLLRWIRHEARRKANARVVASINSILSVQAKPDTRRAESDFDRLQQSYPHRPEYGYDAVSFLKRASHRVDQILSHVAPGNRTLRFLELAAGDGSLGTLFAAAGHDVDLCDLNDWRTSSAKSLRFKIADCCNGLPYPADEFDVVCSFNSMEHFADPRAAFGEMVRVAKPGGLIYLDFGPLYCAPWGLHAYRSLKMPYPQFLFSNDFTLQKLQRLGIFDLGTQRSELQYVNEWRPSQFLALWDSAALSQIDSRLLWDREHLDTLRSYPEAFRGRGLSFEDVTCGQIVVALRKNE